VTWRVELGDSRERLRELADASIDAVVTDPPYELGFMGKKWDASGIAYDVGLWGEVLRVLKPGGHLLAFGATRTYHRMAVAIEDAGFEIRDSIHWVYGSGFPKSLDVSKALDKAAGARGNEGRNMRVDNGAGTASYRATVDPKEYVRPPAVTDAAKAWLGWGTALKPAHEPIVVARKPLDGTVAANVLAHGTGAINVDGCRVGDEPRINPPAANKPGGSSLNLSVRGMPTDVEPMTATGRWPPNTIFSHLPECGDTCAESCAVAELDAQSGTLTSGGGIKANRGTIGLYGIASNVQTNFRTDSGGASRFFPAFRYQAKPARSERDAGLEELPKRNNMRVNAPRESEEKKTASRSANFHPTVKPVELMRWLVRLVTPKGGTVLDPFTGSGTTGCAAILERCSFVGVELSDEYRAIACARIEAAESGRPCEQLDLFGGW